MDLSDFEFSLTQYLDGTLAPSERAAVEERLASDPAAAKLLQEYRNLDAALARAAARLPALNWDRLAHQISHAVDDHAIDEGVDRPIFSFVRAPLRTALALAASLIIVFGLIRLGSRQTAPTPQPAPTLVAVAGPQAEVAAGPSSIEVSVSQPAEAAAAYISNDSLLVRRATVALAGLDDQPAGPEQFR